MPSLENWGGKCHEFILLFHCSSSFKKSIENYIGTNNVLKSNIYCYGVVLFPLSRHCTATAMFLITHFAVLAYKGVGVVGGKRAAVRDAYKVQPHTKTATVLFNIMVSFFLAIKQF